MNPHNLVTERTREYYARRAETIALCEQAAQRYRKRERIARAAYFLIVIASMAAFFLSATR